MMKAKNVQCIFCFVIFFLFVTQAQAAEWISYGSSSSGDWDFDKASIKKVNNNIVQVWVRNIYNENKKMELHSVLKEGNVPNNFSKLSYDVRQFEFDCVNDMVRMNYVTIYDNKDQFVASPKMSGDWGDIVPDTMGETLKNIVCKGSKK
jgi:hypothetical protein